MVTRACSWVARSISYPAAKAVRGLRRRRAANAASGGVHSGCVGLSHSAAVPVAPDAPVAFVRPR
eukprot:4279226-Lingulodinium_polyedra.AAC.1